MNSVSSSQQSFAHDTRYHGPGDAELSPVATDEIPLRTHTHNKTPGYLNESTDHVYDADPSPRRRPTTKSRGGVRFGQLGMLGADRKGIPIVVYVFSLIQIVVFIVELVKAGMLRQRSIC